MARGRKPTPTRAFIIKVASELFFEKGFTKTTAAEISAAADISKGNLTFYFPTKEHILSVLVNMMIEYQWREMESVTDEGASSLLSYCLELSVLATMSEDIPVMKDFLTAAYTHPMTLDLIRASDAEKIRKVFADYTREWNDERIAECEAIISGIEYGTLMITEHTASLPRRIESSLDAIMLLFGVPDELRRRKLEKVLAMNYREIARGVFERFTAYVKETNEAALEAAMS